MRLGDARLPSPSSSETAMFISHRDVIRKALEAGKDPHTAWAAHCLGKKPEEVTREERQQAKAENYVLLYSGDFITTIRWPQYL